MINEKLIRFKRPVRPPSSLNSSPLPPKIFKLPMLSKLSKTPRLDLNLTQKVEMPHITRFNTPDPKREVGPFPLLLPDISNVSSFHLKPFDRQMVNLENLTMQEDKLWKINENINESIQLLPLLADYWESSSDESLWNIEKLFKDLRTKKLIQTSLVIEAVAISLMIFFYSSFKGASGRLIQMKSMMAQVHQNFLTIIDLVLNRLPSDMSSNTWVVKLQETVQKKKFKTLKRAEYSTTLKHNCDIILNCMKTLTHTLPSNTSHLSAVTCILTNVDKYSVSTARNLLSNKSSFSPAERSAGVPSSFSVKTSTKELTLVLDLDETLVHYSSHKGPGTLLVRPYCEEFLKEMGQFFEIIIFTAGVQEYADWAIDLIDTTKVTRLRLYRQHTSMKSGSYVKDLGKLGRDLAKIIIVDNVQSNFQMQPENGISIKTWVGDPNDSELRHMGKVLKGKNYSEIAESKDSDVRNAIRRLRGTSLL